MPKVFGELRQRYLEREGGYTRVTRTEPRDKNDQAETSILEFVDGPKDTKFMMTAKTVARDRLLGRVMTPVTEINVKKVTRYHGEQPFEDMVQRFMLMSTEEPDPNAKTSGRQHWEPKLSGFKMPKTTLPKKTEPAVERQAAASKDEGPSNHEAEASELAGMEQQRTANLGEDIVPESQKQSGKDAEK